MRNIKRKTIRKIERFSAILILLCMFLPVIVIAVEGKETETKPEVIKPIINETTMQILIEELEEETTKSLADQLGIEVSNIPYNFDDIQQKHQWFLAYKEVIAKYPKELHKPTIYESFSKEDLTLLYGVVQAETGNEYSFVEKINVISVIFNRLNSGQYSSLREVLTAPYQFADVVKGKEIDEKTILACEYVFLFGDTTDGCLAFRSDIAPNKWHNWTYQFSDEAHNFYK